MAKDAKKTERDVADRLHALGLRRRVAENIAHATANVKGQLPGSGGGILQEMLAKVDGIGSARKRSEAAEPTGKTKTKGKGKGKGKDEKKKKGKKKKAKKKAAKKAAAD